MCGFLASIGIIILEKAIKICTGDRLFKHPDYPEFWMLLLPAVPIGLALYFSKRFHFAAPIATVPVLLFFPFVLFYIIVYALGKNVEDIRNLDLCAHYSNGVGCSWMFPLFDASPVQQQWVQSFGKPENISWIALAAAIPNFLTMIVILCVDSLLKISATKKLFKISELDYDHEVLLAGKANLFTVFLVGVPG